MERARPSLTAQKIARFVLLLDAMPRLRGVLPDGAAPAVDAVLRGSGVMPAWSIDLMRRPAARHAVVWGERLTGRGQLLWFALRKRWMADVVDDALAAGARQLLVVGAGFDVLAATTAARRPDVLCVELDAPQTSGPKARGVRAAGLARDNLVLAAADLGETSLADALRATPWRSDVKSVVVAEGLLMYLAAEDVDAFLARVRTCVPAGSRLAFTSMDGDERGRPRLPGTALFARVVGAGLALVGEPLRWGVAPSRAPALLGAAGYRVIEQPTNEDLRRRYLAPAGAADEPLMAYEHLVLAERI